MKFLLAGILALVLAPFASAQIAPAPAGSNDGNAYAGYLANEAGLTYNKNYTLDLSIYDASKVAMQVVYGSTTFPSATFNDGQKCAGSFTIASNAGVINPGASVTACGKTFVSGTDFSVNVTYSSMTAKNLKTALAAACSALTVTQVNNTSIVYTTSTLDSSTACNYTTSNQAYISTANITTGKDSGATLNSAVLAVPAHGFTPGLAVLYSTGGAGVSLGGLTNQTTYYVYPVGGGLLQLMAYSTEAVAGVNGIVITSTNTQTASHTFTLAALAITGTPGFAWQSSNDNFNWTQIYGVSYPTGVIAASSVTITSYANPPANAPFDFGFYNFRYLRLSVTAPTTGGLFLQVPAYIKQDGIGRF